MDKEQWQKKFDEYMAQHEPEPTAAPEPAIEEPYRDDITEVEIQDFETRFEKFKPADLSLNGSNKVLILSLLLNLIFGILVYELSGFLGTPEYAHYKVRTGEQLYMGSLKRRAKEYKESISEE